MDKFIPDIYVKSIYDINYESLKSRGIKCLIFDLNNTIAPIRMPVPDKDIKDLFSDLYLMKFKVIIVSNADKGRVEPFKEKLNVDSSFKSHKPFKKKFKKIMSLYDFKDNEIAVIGDQLITDIYGANRMEFLSVLVNPISEIDDFIVRISRVFERKIFKYLEKKNLFKVGEYYE